MPSKNKPFTPKQTLFLKKEYRNNPEEMTHDFCQLFTVKDCRKMLWKMTCAFLGSEHADGLDRHKRSDYIFLYELLLALVEASYLIEAKRPEQ